MIPKKGTAIIQKENIRSAMIELNIGSSPENKYSPTTCCQSYPNRTISSSKKSTKAF